MIYDRAIVLKLVVLNCAVRMGRIGKKSLPMCSSHSSERQWSVGFLELTWSARCRRCTMWCFFCNQRQTSMILPSQGRIRASITVGAKQATSVVEEREKERECAPGGWRYAGLKQRSTHARSTLIGCCVAACVADLLVLSLMLPLGIYRPSRWLPKRPCRAKP